TLLTLILSLSAVALLTVPPATHIHPLSLHDALPISETVLVPTRDCCNQCGACAYRLQRPPDNAAVAGKYSANPPESGRGWLRSRSEEHTSELQSRFDLVCRLLLEKKKTAADTEGDVL